MSNQSKPDYNGLRQDTEKKVEYTALSFDEIRKDIDSLQSDVAGLAADVKKAGLDKAQGAISYVNKNIDTLKTTGTDAVKKVEDQIKSKPGQSITIAFITGVLTSYLFSRRS